MPATDWEKLKQDAQETLDGINTDKLNKDAYMLMGASLAILDHAEPGRENVPAPQISPTQASVVRPTAASGVLDDFSVILSKYNDSRSSADRDEMRAVLKDQLDAIERELVEMRHEVHDDIAVQMFIDFREAIRLKL